MSLVRISLLAIVLACLFCACAPLLGVAQDVKPLFTSKEAIPSDAIVLFDGKDLSQWSAMNTSKPAPWKVEHGYMEARDGSIRTKREFIDCQLHVEFWLPLMADMVGQYRANSGVYMGLYEIQVLDSYGLVSRHNDCGAIYDIAAPMVNANRPPEQWQTYDIFFHSPRFDDQGKKIADARISVLQNGVWIQDNVDIPYPTEDYRWAEKPSGPIRLQDHGNPIRYKNIWVRPLGGK
jgi:hypothetical protein